MFRQIFHQLTAPAPQPTPHPDPVFFQRLNTFSSRYPLSGINETQSLDSCLTSCIDRVDCIGASHLAATNTCTTYTHISTKPQDQYNVYNNFYIKSTYGNNSSDFKSDSMDSSYCARVCNSEETCIGYGLDSMTCKPYFPPATTNMYGLKVLMSQLCSKPEDATRFANICGKIKVLSGDCRINLWILSGILDGFSQASKNLTIADKTRTLINEINKKTVAMNSCVAEAQFLISKIEAWLTQKERELLTKSQGLPPPKPVSDQSFIGTIMTSIVNKLKAMFGL